MYFVVINLLKLYRYICTKQFKECITATILGMINTSNGTQAISTHSITLLKYKVCGSHSGLGAKEKMVEVLNPNRLSLCTITFEV